MAQRVNDLLPHCLHQRNRNGVLLEQCIHCTQPVANTGTTQYTAQHTASLLGLGPDIDPFYGFEAAVERSFDAKERVQQRAYTHRPNTNSSGLQVNQQMQHNEANESVDDMNNASNAFKAGSRTENWLHAVELDIQEEADERECAYSECSLLRAINQDLQQDARNRKGEMAGYQDPNIDPALYMAPAFNPDGKQEQPLQWIEENTGPYHELTAPHHMHSQN